MATVNKFLGFTVIVKVDVRLNRLPIVGNFMYYEDALGFLETKMKPYERAVGCILNHKMEVVYKTEAGIDA